MITRQWENYTEKNRLVLDVPNLTARVYGPLGVYPKAPVFQVVIRASGS